MQSDHDLFPHSETSKGALEDGEQANWSEETGFRRDKDWRNHVRPFHDQHSTNDDEKDGVEHTTDDVRSQKDAHKRSAEDNALDEGSVRDQMAFAFREE